LIEVLAALTIFAIVAAGLAAATITTIRSNSTSRNASTAASLIQDRIERFRALDVTNPAAYAQLVDPDTFEGVEGSDRVDALGNASSTAPFRRNWVVTHVTDADGNIEAGVVRVEVTVEWNDPIQRSITSVAYVCITSLC